MRKERGYTLEAFAGRAKISYQYLSGVETGKENFSLAVLEAIAAALGLPLNVLILTAYDLQAEQVEPTQLDGRHFRPQVPLPEGLRHDQLDAALADAARAMRRINRNFGNEARRPLQDFVHGQHFGELVTQILAIALSQHCAYKLRGADRAACVMSTNGRGGRRPQLLNAVACRGLPLDSVRVSGNAGWYLLALFDSNGQGEARFKHVMVARLQGWQSADPDWTKAGSDEGFAATPSGLTKLLDGSVYLDPAKVDPSAWSETRRDGEPAPDGSMFALPAGGK